MQFFSRPSTLAGVVLMLGGMFLFSVNDVVGKWLVATYTVGQVLLIRSLFALAALAPAVARLGKDEILHPPRPGLQALRVAMSSAEVALFYWAVTYLPLADTVTFYLAGPIYVALLAVPIWARSCLCAGSSPSAWDSSASSSRSTPAPPWPAGRHSSPSPARCASPG